MARNRSKQAYFLIDVTELPAEIREEIMQDAFAGGGTYGVKVVEEVLNGPARTAILGVYYGEDEALWNDAKEEFGIKGTEVPDSSVGGVLEPDPRDEAALRQAAQEIVNAQADAIRTAEEEEVRKVVEGDDEPTKPVNKAKTR